MIKTIKTIGRCILASSCMALLMLPSCSLADTGCQDDAAVAFTIPSEVMKALADSPTGSYTIDAQVSDTSSCRVIQEKTVSASAGQDVSLAFDPVEHDRKIRIFVLIRDSTGTLYAVGDSHEFAVKSGPQSVDMQLLLADGTASSATGIITGRALYSGTSAGDGIVVCITKHLTASAMSADAAHQPVQDILSLHPARTVPAASAANITVSGIVAAATTDSDGKFTFYGIPDGTYNIYAVSSKTLGQGVSQTVAVSGGGESSVQLSLVETGTLSGKVLVDGLASGNAGLFVSVPGTDCIAVTKDDGSFAMSHVPVGTYSLAVQYGSDARTFTNASSATSFKVAAGASSDAGTMTFMTNVSSQPKHYLGDTDNNNAVTEDYVQATKNGIKFVLTSLPEHTIAFSLSLVRKDGTQDEYVYNSIEYGKSASEQTYPSMKIFTFELVNPGEVYTQAAVYMADASWNRTGYYAYTGSIASVGGLGRDTFSSSSVSVTYHSGESDSSQPYITNSGIPQVSSSAFSGTVLSYSLESHLYILDSSGNTTADNNKVTAEMPSWSNSQTITFIDDYSPSFLSLLSGQNFKIKYKYNIYIPGETGYYSVYCQDAGPYTCPAIHPYVTVDANGGTVKLSADSGAAAGTADVKTASDGTTLLTSASTFADVQSTISTLYTLSFASGGVAASPDGMYYTDTSGSTVSVSDVTASALGFRHYTFVTKWNLELNATNCSSGSWSGTYAATSSYVMSVKQDLLAARASAGSVTMAVTADTEPHICWKDGTVIPVTSSAAGSGSTTVYTYTFTNQTAQESLQIACGAKASVTVSAVSL